MPCQCATTATAATDADTAHSGCGCGSGDASSSCECGSSPPAAGREMSREASLERVVMELDMRVRKLEASR